MSYIALYRSMTALRPVTADTHKACACGQTHPGLVGAAVPWNGGAVWQREGADLPRSAGVLILARDTGAGRVTAGPDGLPRAEYWPAPRDAHSMLAVRALSISSAGRESCRFTWQAQ